jgi:hypothetical protein
LARYAGVQKLNITSQKGKVVGDNERRIDYKLGAKKAEKNKRGISKCLVSQD